LYASCLLESISSTFNEQLFRQFLGAKKLRSQTVIREKLRKALLYKKFVPKMLMKLTTGGIAGVNPMKKFFKKQKKH